MINRSPHITVACVVERNGRYLMVEERDKRTGRMVFNQPAGHVEPGELLVEAALRETLEETGWIVDLTGVIGVSLYEPPDHDAMYCRTTFLATPLAPVQDAVIDPDIDRVHWLNHAEISALSGKLRSPLVLACVERHRQGLLYPLNIILDA